MSPMHHPSGITLAAYGSGALPEGPALVVACHLAACLDCRAKITTIETVGGILLDRLQPSRMRPNSLADALARIDTTPPSAVAEPDVVVEPKPEWLPEMLRRRPLGPWRWIAPGMRQIVIIPKRKANGSTRLLRLAPMTKLPPHEHRGTELACVLLGSFADERGCFAVNDVSEADETVRHGPVSGRDGCICLIATTGPLRLRGPVGWLIQALLRF